VNIRSFAHKGLKRLYAEGSAKGVPPDTVDKLRKMLPFLDDMQDPEELRSLPVWKVCIRCPVTARAQGASASPVIAA
jgi:toxin HigB-1